MKSRTFVKVRDASRRPVRGLYRRDGVFYARLTWTGKPGWFKLNQAVDVESAKQEKTRLEALRDQGKLPPARQAENSQTFAQFSSEYLRLTANTKKPHTHNGERSQIEGCLASFFGKMRLTSINQRHVEEFRAKRLKDGLSNRTVNHNIVVLRNVLKKARAFGCIQSDPMIGITSLKLVKKTKNFLPIEMIRAAANWIRENMREGRMIADAVLFLAFTGARVGEGLAVSWLDIDFEREQVCIGSGGDTKNSAFRHVDFHPDLKRHLLAMKQTAKNLKSHLFPSYRQPDEESPGHLKDISESISLARTALKQPHWTPHDLRHHFASRCIMAGVDFKQTAEWLGHRDGGMLVATVYGHLVAGHGKTQAAKLATMS